MLLLLAKVAAVNPFYSINAGTAIPGVTSSWERQPIRINTDGTIDYLPSAVNVWTVPTMDADEYLTFQTAIGAALTSLETNNYAARNSAKTYTVRCFLESISAAQQIGRIMKIRLKDHVIIGEGWFSFFEIREDDCR